MSKDIIRVAMILSDEREVSRRYIDPAPAFGTAPAALLQGLAESPGCELHVVSCLQHSVQSPSKLTQNTFFHAVIVPKHGWLRSGYLGCIAAIRKKLQALRPDVAHGQGTERYCALAAAYSGSPSVITLHGNQRRLARLSRARPFTFDWMQARLESWTLPRVGGVICPSIHTMKEVQPPARRTWTIPNAVDPSFFAVEPSPSPETTIICVGNILVLKNQIGLIRALDPLAATTKFKLIFLGWTKPADSYGQRFSELVRSRPWCGHEGFADRSTLKGWLQSASAMILPSLEENCPMAILEAMAAGTPVIGSNIGGIPDLVNDGVTGFLCDPEDPASIRSAVLKVFENPATARQVATHAKEQAKLRFDPRVVAGRHLEVYRELLTQNLATHR